MFILGKKKAKESNDEQRKLTIAEECVKAYEKQVPWPKKFIDGDKTNMKLYLGFRFKMDIKGLKEKDLKEDEINVYNQVKIYKQYLNNSVYKDVLNWGVAKRAKKLALKAEAKKAKKAERNVPTTNVVVEENPGLIERAKNAVLEKMLDFSIWVNDKLIDMGV